MLNSKRQEFTNKMLLEVEGFLATIPMELSFCQNASLVSIKAPLHRIRGLSKAVSFSGLCSGFCGVYLQGETFFLGLSCFLSSLCLSKNESKPYFKCQLKNLES